MTKNSLAISALLLVTGACSQAAPEGVALQAPVQEIAASEGGNALESLWGEQKLIRNGELVIQVEDVDESAERVTVVAKQYGGLVADSEIVEREGSRRARLTLRVPTTEFDTAMEALRELGSVERDSTSVSDVTKAYADLELRLSTKRRMEARLQALLASKSGDLSAVLEVERELGRVVGEIEELLGEQRYYDQRIATSTITVSLQTRDMGGLRFTQPISKAFGRSLEVIGLSAAVIIYAIALVAPWVVLLAPIWWIASRLKRRWKKNAAP